MAITHFSRVGSDSPTDSIHKKSANLGKVAGVIKIAGNLTPADPLAGPSMGGEQGQQRGPDVAAHAGRGCAP